MSRIIFLLAILQSVLTFGQKVTDTTEMYGSQLTQKKIEFDQNGDKLREIYYFKSGKVELIDSFHSNKSFHWISYDSFGVKNAEWTDPVVAAEPLVKKRNILFGLFLLIISIIIFTIWKFISYRVAYYSVFLLLLLVFAFFTFFVHERISNLSEGLQFIIYQLGGWSILILLSLTFIFSIGNLIFRVNISKFISISIAVLTGLISLFLYMGYISALAGRGAIG